IRAGRLVVDAGRRMAGNGCAPLRRRHPLVAAGRCGCRAPRRRAWWRPRPSRSARARRARRLVLLVHGRGRRRDAREDGGDAPVRNPPHEAGRAQRPTPRRRGGDAGGRHVVQASRTSSCETFQSRLVSRQALSRSRGRRTCIHMDTDVPAVIRTRASTERTRMFITKRLAAATALAAGAALVLAGCAGDSAEPAATFDPDEKVTLDLAFWGNDVRAELYDAAID